MHNFYNNNMEHYIQTVTWNITIIHNHTFKWNMLSYSVVWNINNYNLIDFYVYANDISYTLFWEKHECWFYLFECVVFTRWELWFSYGQCFEGCKRLWNESRTDLCGSSTRLHQKLHVRAHNSPIRGSTLSLF